MVGERARRVGIDVGGTFTDILIANADGATVRYKIPSTEERLAETIERAGIDPGVSDEFLHSTTVALNRLLTGDIPPIGVLVTRGFRDILETARLPGGASDVFDVPLPRLVPLEFVTEVAGRLDAHGNEIEPIDESEITAAVARYRTAGINVLAVALLHSYANGRHEQQIAQCIAHAAPEITVILSSDVLPEIREYERTLATAVNACLVPVLRRHLPEARDRSVPRLDNIRLMQANGGLVRAADGLRQPANSAGSGRAAAVVGMRQWGEAGEFDNLITFDVGGTSTDVALIQNARYNLTTRGEIAGYPIKTSQLDVLSIGAGGGSIAFAAPDGRWHVGPRSAAAHPGPACYDRGGQEPTLTDAQLLLGRLPAQLLGGVLPLQVECAEAALSNFGRARGLDPYATARGILEIATYNMCGAVRTVAMSRGVDPGAFVLMALGGAGAQHAAELAELLGMHTVVVPPTPGAAAAYGLLVANIETEFIVPLDGKIEDISVNDLNEKLARLRARVQAWAALEHLDASAVTTELCMDMRYSGMMHESGLPCAMSANGLPDLVKTVESFHDYFEQLTGRSWRDHEAVEIVNLRLRAHARPLGPEVEMSALNAKQITEPTYRTVSYFGRDPISDVPVYVRGALQQSEIMNGPMIVEENESTIVVPPDWALRVDDRANLVLTLNKARPATRGHSVNPVLQMKAQ